jgi:outer membrane protein OmpA-like peptidoglycan-associated protein
MRPSTLALAVTLAATAAGAQEAGEVRDLEFPIRELLLRVQDLAGRVQALQVRETATETRIELPADILFDFDKADIRRAAEPALAQAAEIIRQGAKGTVRIEGHTDAKGASAYNAKLSQRRAAAVQKWLVDREAVKGRFASSGFGAQRPVAPNTRPDGSDDPEGRQKNRRVEIVFSRK